jgi:hypothetical protein
MQCDRHTVYEIIIWNIVGMLPILDIRHIQTSLPSLRQNFRNVMFIINYGTCRLEVIRELQVWKCKSKMLLQNFCEKSMTVMALSWSEQLHL